MNLPKIRADLEGTLRRVFPHPEFRQGQDTAILEILEHILFHRKKHVFLDAPTGSGKSAIAYSVHKVIAEYWPTWRSTIATRTISLQDQYVSIYPEIYDLRSKVNYPCYYDRDGYYDTVRCKMRRLKHSCRYSNCQYLQRRDRWCTEERLRSTNHSFLLECCTAVCASPENRCNLIIMDEAHNINDTIVAHSIVNIDAVEVEKLYKLCGITSHTVLSCIRQLISMASENGIYLITEDFRKVSDRLYHAAMNLYSQINTKVATLTEAQLEDYAEVIDGSNNLKELAEILVTCTPQSAFFIEENTGNAVRMKPVLGRYTAPFRLFRKADMFLYMSSTLCGIDSLAKMIGVDPSHMATVVLPNNFPVANRRVYYAPVAKVSKGNKAESMPRIVEALDKIISTHFNRGDKKGIVHAVSFENANYILQNSKFAEFITVPRNAAEAVRALSNSGKCVVVSPSIEEGLDFKDGMSRFQIIVKVPFGYLGDPLIHYVFTEYPGIYARNAISRIIQACGRSIRHADDFAATYILDKNFDLLINKYRSVFPKWFLDAMVKVF